jgi:signal transduction histidine kinase
VAEERARIAREMHDVVAHGMSVMVVQAAAAEHLIAEHPEQARAPLATVRETGQQSLAEMRRLLGLLRTGSGAPPDDDRGPQPNLSQVPAMVAQLQAAGMPVTLSMAGSESAPVDVPPGLDLCAYRIVQEALTNALKHGQGAPTTVAVRTSESEVELTITTSGPSSDGHRVGPATSAAGGGDAPGHGLIGMQERVGLYGGTLIARAQPDGGFLVHAHLPVPR